MTTANKITILRILLVPFFVVQVLYYIETGLEYHRWLALLAFGVASISDGVDGYIARKFNQRSELGAFLDPLADKLLLVSAIILLSWSHAPYLARLPLWLTVTILSRDLILLMGVGVIRYMGGRLVVRPVIIGKVATVLQMVCVLWALLKWPEKWLIPLCLGAGICTAASGVLYVLEGMRQLSASPAAVPQSKKTGNLASEQTRNPRP